MIVFFIIFLSWIFFGFIAFLIEARMANHTEFDDDALVELMAAMFLGLISLIILTHPFKGFMNFLLKKINES